MDVRHFAFMARQPSARVQPREHFWGLPKRGLALILANALFWQPLLANADGIVVSAPGTSLGAAGNGVPIVNIAAPNGSGLSHNQFKDYNVGANGVILNNATDRTPSTQLGGIILGNPNLQGRAANIILNEVNGGSPSQLRGYTEVAGQSAKVIVANPYGISCNGCGFINTPNVTLTTGKPILDNGRLDRYQVDGGAVTIDGQGLNASNVDRFEIITRSAKINAQINARNLTVIAGRNDVNAQTLNTTARADDDSTKPELAIDSSALGGMYAGAIKLVGTEAGVGVKLDGTLAASGGDIQLDANGHLSMAQAAASGAVNIKAASLDAQGPVYAGTALDVQTQGDLNSRKTLAARDSITLTSGGQLTNSGIIEAGVNADNTRNATGDLNLTAQTVNNNASSLVASRNLTVNATQALNNQGGTLSAKQVANISAGTLDNQNKGRVLSTGSLTLNASQLLNAQGGLVNSSGPLSATVGQLNNRSGEVSSLDTATLNIASLDNVAGLVTAGNALSLTASGAINNLSGKLTSQGTLNLKAGAVDNSAAGRIASNQALTANVVSLNNSAGQLTSVTSLTLDVNKGQLNNQSGLIRGPALALNNLADVGNQSGEISSAQGFTFTAKSLDNTGGKLLSDQALNVRLDQALTNVKGVVSANGLDVRAASVNNSTGTLTSDAGLLLNLDGALANNLGEVSSTNATQVQVASLDNSGGKVTGDTSLSVDVRGALNNRQGVLGTGQTASITAASLDNSNTGKVLSDGSLTARITGLLDSQNNGLLTAKGAMDVQAGSLDNRGGSLSGRDLLTLNTASLDNRGGKVSADKNLQLNVTQLNNQDKGLLSGQSAIQYLGTTLSNQGGLLSGVGPVRLDATTVENAGGRISSKSDLTANVTHFNQQKGELVAEGNLRLSGSTLDNRNGGLIGATKALTLTVDDINNQAGEISSAVDVNLAGTRFNNSGNGKLLAGTDLGLKVAQVINQSEGLLFGKGKVTLQGQSLDNSGGTVSGQQGLTLTHSGDLNNTGGLLTSQGSITATTAGLNNTAGKVSSAGAIALTATGAMTNHNGAVTTDQGLILNSASLGNSGGTLSAKGAVGVTTGAFDNTQAGRLISNDTLTLTAGQVSNGTHSRIASDKNLVASVTGFDQQGGQLYSKTSLSLDLNNGQLNNQQGLINAPLLMLKNLNGVNNQNGEISSAQAFTLASKSLDNSSGKLISNQALTLRVEQALSNIKGLVSAAALQVHSASLDNSGGLLSSRGELGLTVDGAFKNQDGSAIGDGNAQLTAASLDNTDGQVSSKGDLTVNVAAVTNQNGALIAQGALALTGQTLDNRKNGFVGANQRADVNVGAVDNRGGEISSKAAVQITGQRLDNSDSGLVLAATDLKLNVDKVLNRNKGQLSGQSGVNLAGDSLDNSGGSLISQKDLALKLGGELNNSQGKLSSEGLLTVNAASLNNRQGSVSSAGALNVTTPGAVDNQGGELVTDAGLTLSSASLDNRQKGTLSSTAALKITTGAFDNSHAGNVSTSDTLDITAGQLTNQDGGRLTSNKALIAKVTGLDQQGGKLFSNTSVALDLNNGQLNNQGGLINGPLLMLKNLKGVNNQGGELSSAQAFTLAADSLDNTNGKLLSNQALTLRINQALSNVKGLIAAQSIDGRAASLDNSGGTLTSRGDTSFNVDGPLNNQSQGLINAANALTLNSTGLNNQGGSVLGKSIAIDLGNATGDLNNNAGLITTDGQLTVKHLRDLSNQGGEISTAQNLNLSGRTLDNSTGKLISNNLLTLSGNKLVNQSGLISGWQGVSVSGADLDNRNQGTVSSRYGNVDAILSNSLLNSGAGALVSQKALTVNAGSLDNSDKGILSSAGGQTLTVTGLLNNAQGGLIDSGAALDLQAQTLNNAGGTVNAQQALSLTGTSLDNSGGTLIGNGAVTLDLLGALTNTNGKLASAGALLLKRATEINNQGGQLASQGLLTLFAGSLDNRNRGTVAANGAVAVTTTGAVQNSGDGLIYSQSADLKLKAASLDNAKGSIQSQTALNLEIDKALDNQSGKVIAQAGDVNITAATIDNRGGTLASLKGALQAKALGGLLRNDFDLNNNRQAGIIQAQSLILTSASLNNNGGRIASQTGDTDVTTSAFDNRDGGLYAKGAVKVIGGSFDNSGDVRGQVAGGEIDLDLSGALNNQKGIIESDSTLKVVAGSVDNQSGQLRALGTSGKTDFQIGGLFDNRSGALETANSDLTLNAGSFQNVGGSVLHVGAGTFDISTANLTNAGGTVITRGGLTLTADNWTNSSVIQAGRLTVNVNTLNQAASGQLLASNSLVGNGGNWSNDGLIASDGSLSLNLAGTYSGSGRVSSLGTLGLSAAQMNLSSAATLAGGGNTTVSVTGQLNNAGRMTSATDLTLTAGSVNNTGTLGAGQNLTVTAGTLLNDRGLIFSGADMQLLSPSFTNSYAQVYSLGSLLIARDKDGTKADLLDNRSAGIESVGNLTLAATTLNNTMDVLQYTEHEKSATTITRLSCALIPIWGCDNRGGGRFNGLWEVSETDRLLITLRSAAATINSGADLVINARELNNTSSSISAAGNLTANATTINNKGVQAQEIKSSQQYVSYVDQTGRAAQLAAIFNQRNSPTPSATVEADLSNFLALTGPPAVPLPKSSTVTNIESLDAIIQAGGAVTLNAVQNINNSVVRPYYAYVSAGKTKIDTGAGSGYSTAISINAQLPPDVAQQQVNPITLPGFSLPTGQNGLFRLSGQGAATPTQQGPQSWTMGSAVIDTAQREQAVPASGGRAVQVGNAAQTAVTTQATVHTADLAANVAGSAATLNVVTVVDPATGATLPGRSDVGGVSSATPVEGQATSAGALTVNRVQGLPGSSYVSNPQKYLIETNPALTDLKQFMGSDYLLSKLGYNPDNSWKRLGDGLYEQRLIQQAVIARTGQRFIDNQTSDAGLYKYLMDNAIASKQQLNLAVGVSLTSEQVAALTHDIVWLENATVAGQQVLVPVLYLAQANNRLGPNGALIAGNDVNLIAGENLNNVGTLRATNNLSARAGANLVNSGLIEAGNRLDLLAGNNLINKAGGIISGRDVSLTAVNGDVINERTVTTHESSGGAYIREVRQDFVDNAARIEAANNLSVRAGRDVNSVGGVMNSGADMTIAAGRDVNLIAAEQRTGRGTTEASTGSVTQHGTVIEAGRDFRVQAGRDISAIASRIDAKRDVAMAATGDLTLASGVDEQHYSYNTKKVDIQEDHIQQVSTSLVAGGNVALSAGQDLELIASRVSAGKEAYLYAGGDLNLNAAQDSDYSYYRKTSTSNSGLSSTQKTRMDSSSSTTQQGSSVSADTVVIRAGQDIGTSASDIVSTNGTSLIAGRNVVIDGATETFEQSHSSSTKKSGLLSSGGIGFTLGSTSNQNTSTSSTETTRASNVGSVLGSVNIEAGKDLTIRGSDVVAGKDIRLVGQNVNILADENNNRSEQTSKSKSSGLTLALSGTVGSAVDSAYQTAKQARNEDDSRLSALQGVKAGLTGVQAWQAAQQNGGMTGENAGQFVGIAISLGGQKSSSKQTQEQTVSQGSSLTSGNNLTIVAAGNGTPGADGDIRIQGSKLQAGNEMSLAAERDIRLEAAANTQKLDGKNNSSGGAIGASIGFSSSGGGLSIFANANKGTGSEKGNGTTWTETTLDAGKQVSLISGRDTTLKGAQVNADKITANVGRDLTLQSLQDSDDYKSKQTDVSGGVSVAIIGTGGSASLSVSKSKIDSKYESVQEQTGLFSGKGGYQVDVKNHTQLDGSVIASTADADKNRLSTGTLGWSEIKNKADYTSKLQSASVSSSSDGAGKFVSNMPSGTLIAFNHGDSASGTTSSAISKGTLDIRDPGKQQQDVATLSHDVEHANDSISPIFDKEKEQKRLRQVQLIGDIGTQTIDIVRTQGDLNASDAARKELAKEGIDRPTDKQIHDSAAYKKIMADYGVGGDYPRVAQAVTAALQGLVGGDIGSAIAGASAPYLAQVIKKTTGDNTALNTMAHAVLGAVVAQAQGNSALSGAAGAATGEYIAHQLYPGTATADLTQEQKETVVALSGLAAGLAGGIAGGDLSGAVTGAQAGSNAVENNYLSKQQKAQKDKELAECPTVSCRAGTATKWAFIDVGQDASFGLGAAAGIPLGLNDAIDGIVHTAGNLKETYQALRAVVESGGVWDTVKQSYIDRIDKLEMEYEKAGPSGSFQAGVETGKLLTDMAGVLSVGVGIAKGGALLAEKVTAKVVARAELAGVKTNPAWDNAVSKADGDFGYLPPVRQAYIKDVYDLQGAVEKMRASGASAEEVAKFAYDARNDIKIKYREYTPPEMINTIDARNMERYGNKLGPQFDDLLKKGKSFEQIIESSTRAGGGDLFQ